MKYVQYAAIWLLAAACQTAEQPKADINRYNEPHRPQIHFSPDSGWMNDPNGMVYHDGVYHLFYQHYPDSTVWGPMHWGHATSTNLVQWEHKPIALFPDSLGYIFSGSAVIDEKNTSGFGTDGKTPLIAIYTSHDMDKEKAGAMDVENQSIAYSLDNGKTWTKYAGNPVLKNTGVRDFRDPKVRWHEGTNKWIMTLATKDRITFFSSPDFKTWTKESEFGSAVGAHGGVWECPDLFPISHNGQQVWVLIVNLNPGGPNGGSATQYFTGNFDGHTFTPLQTDTRWLDYGPDEYAGITWSNTGDRRVFMGWMSNWQYANVVPTDRWRSAMTIPRDLGLKKVGDKYLVTSKPSPELEALATNTTDLSNINLLDAGQKAGTLNGPARLQFTAAQLQDCSITLANDKGEKVVIGFNKAANQYYIDRTQSGKTDFEKGFAGRHVAPRLTTAANSNLDLVIDNASVELFADGGLTVMTSIFFPTTPFTTITYSAPSGLQVATFKFQQLKSIW